MPLYVIDIPNTYKCLDSYYPNNSIMRPNFKWTLFFGQYTLDSTIINEVACSIFSFYNFISQSYFNKIQLCLTLQAPLIFGLACIIKFGVSARFRGFKGVSLIHFHFHFRVRAMVYLETECLLWKWNKKQVSRLLPLQRNRVWPTSS